VPPGPAPDSLGRMEIEVRTIADAEVSAWTAALNTGFLNPAGDIDAESRRPGLILDRTYAGFDGDRIVATLRSFPATLTVPGGTVATSALTAVTTTSTHRRRGIAARMVAADLTASAARGEAASILIAAEWGIYGRFGYGPATEHQTLTVDSLAGGLRNRPQGTVEYVDRDTARTLAPEIFERHRRGSPGEITRNDRYWDVNFGILQIPSWGESKPAFSVVARDPGGSPIGFARYQCEEKWEYRRPKSRVNVQALISFDPDGYALLWDHLLGLDLMASVRIEDRSPDELLPWLLTDARHVEPSDRADFLWLRPLDVAALLAARTYLVSGRLVIEVVDSAGFAGGRYALDGGPDGATCVPTSDSPDLTVGVAGLGSVYLGGHAVRTLAAAGLVDEHTKGAVAQADTMFRSPITPWCSTWF
jgi:predicted acetyltransferase